MSKYTMTIEEVLRNDGIIFDFSYPIIEEYREEFEQLFIDYFMFDEIGTETFARFKLTLKTRLNLVMPYWNKIYESQSLEQRILDNYDITELYDRTTKNDVSGVGTSNNTTNSNGTNMNKNLYKDTPKTKIDISNIDIVNSITKDEGTATTNGTNENTSTSTNNGEGEEHWTRKMTGNMGVQTDAMAIVGWWNSLRMVTLEIFEKELSQLFMGVY